MVPQDLNDIRWLISPAAAPWLQAAGAWTGGPLAMAQYLRGHIDPRRARLVAEQAELRHRAAGKFQRAAELFFTRQGLEQATDEFIARYKARRWPAGARIWDLCCGIGGDLLGLAERGQVLAVDYQPVLTLFAAANARAYHFTEVGTRTEDVRRLDLPADVWVHIDPDRRPAQRRVAAVEFSAPGMVDVGRIVLGCRGAAVKLAPAARAPAPWCERGELEWIERLGECRQQVAWLGELTAQAGLRRATLLDNQGQPRGSVVGRPEPPAPPAPQLGRFLYEPSAAVLAAGLADTLAAEWRLRRVADRVAYLTADTRLDHPALTGFEVRDVLPFDVRRLKAYLRQHHVGHVDIKKRGVEVAPHQLARQLASTGPETATVLLTPTPRGVVAVVAQRLPRG